VTGSAIAIPLLGASGASAADGTTWDRVADCETGGAWSQNSGNGYYGGLQLSQEDWENHGGLDYAASADLASRSQQIAVAERILADQGVGAWRTCGLLSGLQQDKGSDSSDSSDSSGSEDSPGLLDSLGSSPSASPSSSPSSPDTSSSSDDETAKPSESSDSSQDRQSDGAPSATPESGRSGNSQQSDDSSAPTDTGSGRHRGPSADETGTPESGRADESTGRHSSRGGEASGDASEGAYIVGVGDSLWSIADALRVSGGWHALYDGNEKAVGTDPNLIHPGQKLTVEGEGDEE
jgi:hypothetical protein